MEISNRLDLGVTHILLIPHWTKGCPISQQLLPVFKVLCVVISILLLSIISTDHLLFDLSSGKKKKNLQDHLRIWSLFLYVLLVIMQVTLVNFQVDK
jgi:cytochrome bd-type quinol oxidase subunit 2